jgi:ClpP class serine protease
MPSWNTILEELHGPSIYDVVRRKYLKELSNVTGRNVIAYYSGWQEKGFVVPGHLMSLDDGDKNGFMAAIHELDRSKGLDLVLHTPGGSVAATESLVDYLRKMFDTNLRVIVPHMAMSAGTMVALAAREILMGKHSSLGPIDPQVMGVSASAVIEEFEKAKEDIRDNPASAVIWQPIIAKYSPTLIGECQKALVWAESIAVKWLESGMFAGRENAAELAGQVAKKFGSHSESLSHERHFSAEYARAAGLEIINIEDNDELQEAILSVHHACIHTLRETGAVKIIENHNGVAFISMAQMVGAPGMPQGVFPIPPQGGMNPLVPLAPVQVDPPTDLQPDPMPEADLGEGSADASQ